jgi:hypothetical protein
MSRNEHWTRVGAELQRWLRQQYRAVPEKTPWIDILGSL